MGMSACSIPLSLALETCSGGSGRCIISDQHDKRSGLSAGDNQGGWKTSSRSLVPAEAFTEGNSSGHCTVNFHTNPSGNSP